MGILELPERYVGAVTSDAHLLDEPLAVVGVRRRDARHS